MPRCSNLQNIFTYETSKVVEFQSFFYSSIKWIIHSGVFLYVCGVLILEKRYQEKDSVISSVHTKVKGISQAENRIWDTAEYTLPMQGINSFFVLTNILKTEKQIQGRCPEFPLRSAVCSSDRNCEKDRVDPQSNGIQTGKCIKYNETFRTCEVDAWCPVESNKAAPVPAILRSAENFTVLIKNNIHFPKFNYIKRNILPEFNISCTYHKSASPYCPIFRLGDILQAAGENFSEVAVQGGIVGIEINWDCNLDKWRHRCQPKYAFRRLDDKKATEALYPGYNFRFARYYKRADGVEERTLIKAYGIRFDILVFGTAGQFSVFELLVYIGSALSYFGLAKLVVDFLITSYACPCSKTDPVREYYYERKCEVVPGPRQNLLYVTHVDEPQIFMIDIHLTTSLQNVKGKKVKSRVASSLHSARSAQRQQQQQQQQQQPPNNATTSPANAPELQLLCRSKEDSAVPSYRRPPWCSCGKCRPAEEKAYMEQLCCRKKEGPCLSRSALFEQLIVSRPTVEFALLYEDPLADLRSETVDRQLRHCAYEQYIRWRFGDGDLGEWAVIPNCCRWRIRDVFPSNSGHYAGFKRKK